MSSYEEDSALSFIRAFKDIPVDWFKDTIWYSLAKANNQSPLNDDELYRRVIDISSTEGKTIHEKYTS